MKWTWELHDDGAGQHLWVGHRGVDYVLFFFVANTTKKKWAAYAVDSADVDKKTEIGMYKTDKEAKSACQIYEALFRSTYHSVN